MRCTICQHKGTVGVYLPDPRNAPVPARKLTRADLLWVCWKCHEHARDVVLGARPPNDAGTDAYLAPEVDRVLASMLALALTGAVS